MPEFTIAAPENVRLNTDTLMDVDEFIQRLHVGGGGFNILQQAPSFPKEVINIDCVGWWLRKEAEAFIEEVQS